MWEKKINCDQPQNGTDYSTISKLNYSSVERVTKTYGVNKENGLGY
jgi:hypothetical protein